jgi:hypothetical protein
MSRTRRFAVRVHPAPPRMTTLLEPIGSPDAAPSAIVCSTNGRWSALGTLEAIA